MRGRKILNTPFMDSSPFIGVMSKSTIKGDYISNGKYSEESSDKSQLLDCNKAFIFGQMQGYLKKGQWLRRV